MAASTVIADLPGPKLVPGLGHVQDHAFSVERLKREGHISRYSGQEARVGIPIGIGRLDPLVPVALGSGAGAGGRSKLANGDLAEDSQSLVRVAAECPARFRAALTIGCWLHHQDSNR